MQPVRRTVLFIAVAVAAACSDRIAAPVDRPDDVAFSSHNACVLGVSDAQAIALIEALIEAVNDLEADGKLSSGQANALRNHLTNARRHIENGRYCPALAQLNAFKEQVGNFVEDGVLDPEDAGPLLDDADNAIVGLPNRVTIDGPSPAAGVYGAAGASFGPLAPLEGISGEIVLANDGSAEPTRGCHHLLDFPAGAIALIDRGSCLFRVKVLNAQDAGAVAVIIVNSVPGLPVTQGGLNLDVHIPSVMVSDVDGATIKAGLPATGTVSRIE